MSQNQYTKFWHSQFPMIMGIVLMITALGAKNWATFIGSTLVSVGLFAYAIYRVKITKVDAGKARFKLGIASQVATIQGRPFWIIGAVCFSLLAAGAIVSLVSGDGGWHSLSSALIGIGLVPTFFIPVFPRYALVLSLLFATCFFAGGGASVMQAIEEAKSSEPNASLQVTKQGLYAALLLIGGGIPLLGIVILKIKGSPTPQTTLFEHGFYSQQGYVRWEMVHGAKLTQDSVGPVLQIPIPGNLLQMSVPDHEVGALADFLSERTTGFINEVQG